MREPHFEELRAYAGRAVRQPAFADIQRRARRTRRRRAAASSAAAVVAVLVVIGVGFAVTAGSRGGAPVAGPTPATSEEGWPQFSSLVAGGSKDLYGLLERCRGCAPELYASSDAGTTWQRRAVPPAPGDGTGVPRISTIVSLGQGILAWRDGRVLELTELDDTPSGPADDRRLWTTVDGGRTWRRAVVEKQAVAAVPAGTRPVDCHLVADSPCRIYAVNPVSGRFAPLAAQPPGITVASGWTGQTNVPLDLGLWVPGLDPVTRKPAVAASSDGGRSWRTRVFTDGVAAESHDGMTAAMYLPTVAAGPDGTAYALTYRADLRKDTHRTADAGASWVAGDSVPEIPDAGFVTADGRHVVTTGRGFLADRRDGDYRAVTLPGYPAGQQPPAQHPAAGLYLVSPTPSVLLSGDGWTWRRVHTP